MDRVLAVLSFRVVYLDSYHSTLVYQSISLSEAIRIEQRSQDRRARKTEKKGSEERENNRIADWEMGSGEEPDISISTYLPS